jgi:glycerol uptake facilitator-like aquaporin
MLGGIVAAYILHGLVPGQTEINLKLSASANIAQGLFIETFATTTLILAVLMLGVGTSSFPLLASVVSAANALSGRCPGRDGRDVV